MFFATLVFAMQEKGERQVLPVVLRCYYMYCIVYNVESQTTCKKAEPVILNQKLRKNVVEYVDNDDYSIAGWAFHTTILPSRQRKNMLYKYYKSLQKRYSWNELLEVAKISAKKKLEITACSKIMFGGRDMFSNVPSKSKGKNCTDQKKDASVFFVKTNYLPY